MNDNRFDTVYGQLRNAYALIRTPISTRVNTVESGNRRSSRQSLGEDNA